MKPPLKIRIEMRCDAAPDWCLEVHIDHDQLDGIAREAAGIDGGAEWRVVEMFVRSGVRDALLNWAENTMPAVKRIRAERDLLYAQLDRNELMPGQTFLRLQNFARRELKSKQVECEEQFAQFVFKHFGGHWMRLHDIGGSIGESLPRRVFDRVAELAAARMKR